MKQHFSRFLFLSCLLTSSHNYSEGHLTTPAMSDFEPLTSTVKPLTQSVLTIRIIKSFPYRNVKNIILKDYDIAHKTPKDLFEDIMKEIKTVGGLRPYRNVEYDTLKIYTHAHGSKTMNLVINFEHDDDWTLDLSSTSHLHELGVGEYFLARSLVHATNT